jgi:chromosome partitioning protein
VPLQHAVLAAVSDSWSVPPAVRGRVNSNAITLRHCAVTARGPDHQGGNLLHPRLPGDGVSALDIRNSIALWRHNASVTKIVVCHSRKGGVGKSTIAYELAWLLDAPLIDLDWEDGGVSRTWGYRWEERARTPLLDALNRRTTPRLLSGFHKPDLVPSHPDLELNQPSAEDMGDVILKWAGEWGRDWVVVDTHPGATDATNGALSVAHAVVVPVPLATKDLNATEQLVKELADYPVILVPNKIPPTPPDAEIKRLSHMIDGTPVRVAPPIPHALAVGTRKRRMAITSEDPPAHPLRPVASALQLVAQFVKEYVDD